MRKFRLGAPPASPARRFSLPTEPVRAEVYEPKFEALTGPGYRDALVLPKPASPPAPPPVARAQVSRRATGFTVRAPAGPRKGRRVLPFTAATDRSVAALMGTLRLECGPNNIDLERLRLGLLSLAVDHVSSLLIGRITSATMGGGRLDMEAEISDSSYARRILGEIDDGLRIGFSPGFQILQAEPLSESDRDYDSDAFIQIAATRWAPHEISNSAVPRNPLARIKGKGEASMENKNRDPNMAPPELVSIDDEIGLGLSAGRMAMKSGQGTERQRVALERFFAAYDDAIARGESRDAAAYAAREAAGLA